MLSRAHNVQGQRGVNKAGMLGDMSDAGSWGVHREQPEVRQSPWGRFSYHSTVWDVSLMVERWHPVKRSVAKSQGREGEMIGKKERTPGYLVAHGT